MPFTFGGDYIPPQKIKSKKPVKICLEKRRGKYLTKILHLPLSLPEMQDLASQMKKKLGAGGSIKNDCIEIQGNRMQEVQKFLLSKGYKT